VNEEGLQKLHEAIVADEATRQMIDELHKEAWAGCTCLTLVKFLAENPELASQASIHSLTELAILLFKVGYLVGRQWEKLEAYRVLLEAEYPGEEE